MHNIKLGLVLLVKYMKFKQLTFLIYLSFNFQLTFNQIYIYIYISTVYQVVIIINMSRNKIISSLVFLAIITAALCQSRTTLLTGRVDNVVTAPNIVLGNFLTSQTQLFWVHHVYDPIGNLTKVKVKFFDPTKAEKFTLAEASIAGTFAPKFFNQRCGFGLNVDTTEVVAYAIDPNAMTVTMLPAIGSLASLAVAFSATQMQINDQRNWDIHENCLGARYKNHVAIFNQGTFQYQYFPSTMTIRGISQNLEYAIASGPSDAGLNYLYKLDWASQTFVKVGNKVFENFNIVKSSMNNLAITSCTEAVNFVFSTCKNYLLIVEASGIVSLIDESTTITTSVSNVLIFYAQHLDIILFVSAHSDKVATVVMYDPDIPLKKLKKINFSTQFQNFINTLRNVMVKIKIQRDGFTVMNVYQPSTTQAYQVYLRIDQKINQLVSYGRKNLTLESGYSPKLSKFQTIDGKNVILSESIKGTVQDFIQYKLQILQLTPPDRPIPTFSDSVINTNVTGIKRNGLFSRQQRLDWVVFIQDDTSVGIIASFYDQTKVQKIDVVIQKIPGSWSVLSTNDWDCFVLKENNSSSSSSIKIYSIDRNARTINQMTTNIALVAADLSIRLSATNGQRKIFVADQCKAFSVDNFVYYLNDAQDTYTLIDMPAVNLAVQNFDRTMQFATLRDTSVSKNFLYHIKSDKTGFDKISFTHPNGTSQAVQIFSYGSQLRSNKDSAHETIVLTTWSDYTGGNGSGKYLVGMIPVGQPFRLIYQQTASGLKSRPYLFSSNKNTISGVYVQLNQGKFIRGTNNLFEFSASLVLKFPPKAELIATGLASSGVVSQNYILMNIANNVDVLYRVRGPQLIEVSSKTFTTDQSLCYSRSIIQERADNDYIFRQYVCPIGFGSGFNFQLTKNVITNRVLAIPSVPQIIKQQDLIGATQFGIGSPRHSLRWIYLTYPDASKTSIKVLFYDHAANTITTADHNLTGHYDLLAANEIGWDCGVFKKHDTLQFAMVKLDLTAKTFANMPDINPAIAALDLREYPRVHVGKQCNAVAVNNNIFRINAAGNDWQVADTTGITFTKFDERIQYALGRPVASPTDPLKLYVYSKPAATHQYTLVPNSETYLPEVTQFQSYDKTIAAISLNKNADGTFRGKAIVTVHNSTGANNIFLQEQVSLVNIPRMITNQMITIGMIIFQTNKLNTKIYTTTIDQSAQSLVSIPQHEKTRILSGYQDVYIYIDNNYAVIHPIPPAGKVAFQEIYLEFFKDKVYLLGTKFINPILAPYWHSTIFKQINGEMVIFSDYFFPKNLFKEDFRLILTKETIGSITVPINSKDSKFAKMGSGSFKGTGGKQTECIPNCASCSDSSTCDKCASGFVKKANNKCGKCINNCKTCAEGAEGTCLSCFPGFYKDGIQCKKCNKECLECDTVATNCTLCFPGQAATSLGCKECTDNCVSCTYDSAGVQQCSECRPGTSLHNGKCRECLASCSVCDGARIATCYSCDAGYLFVDGSCLECGAHCQLCTSSSNCVTCQDGYQLVAGVCHPNCEFPCVDCTPGNPTECISQCWAGYTFNTSSKKCDPDLSCNAGSSCTICPAQYALAAAAPSTCQPCAGGDKCRKCEDAALSTCLQCKFGFYLQDSNQCLACPTNCTSCQNEEVCTTCVNTHFEQKGQCIACQFPCLTCKGAADKCESCNETAEYFLVGWKCLYNEYVNFTIRINIDLALFYDNYDQIRAALVGAVNAVGDKYITFFEIKSGSSIAVGQVTNQNNDPNMHSTLMAALASGSSIAGFQILESSFTASTPTVAQEGANLGLILGLAIPIPLLIIAAIIIGVVIYKKMQAGKTISAAVQVHQFSQVQGEFSTPEKSYQ